MSFPEGHRNHSMDFTKEVSATGDTKLVSLLQLDDVLGFLERTASHSILCCIAVDNCRIRFLLIHVVMFLTFFFFFITDVDCVERTRVRLLQPTVSMRLLQVTIVTFAMCIRNFTCAKVAGLLSNE